MNAYRNRLNTILNNHNLTIDEFNKLINIGFGGDSSVFTFNAGLPFTGRGYTGSATHYIPEYRYAGGAIDGEALGSIIFFERTPSSSDGSR
jgi:hypothetical protein